MVTHLLFVLSLTGIVCVMAADDINRTTVRASTAAADIPQMECI